MSKRDTVHNKKPLTKQELREREARTARRERRDRLVAGKKTAIAHAAERKANYVNGRYVGPVDDYDFQERNVGANNFVSPAGETVDSRFVADIQKVKFCRKPVGFIMTIVFILCIAVIAMSFVKLNLGGVDLTKYLAMFMETEPKTTTPDQDDQENPDDQNPDENPEDPSDTPSNAASGAHNADGEGEDDGKDLDPDPNPNDKQTPTTDTGVYYSFSDPLYGWINYIAGKFNLDLGLGDAPWYNEQLAKVDYQTTDKVVSVLILAFPAAMILYLIVALALVIKTIVCWASGDRRIYRFTWLESLIMVLLGFIVALGGYATTIPDGEALSFGNILNFLIGGVTGAGGFTLGYGMLAMIGLPLIGFILSWFLLERKLRGRDVTQPIIVYETKGRKK